MKQEEVEHLIGTLEQDPEVNYDPSGTAVVNFSIMTSETYEDSNGEKQERSKLYHIVGLNNLGEMCMEYLKKGDRVYIEGRPQIIASRVVIPPSARVRKLKEGEKSKIWAGITVDDEG